MKITQIEVSNFKCFKSEKISDLGSLVGIVGPNNCGKSSIFQLLKAIKKYIIINNNNNFPELLNLRINKSEPISLQLFIEEEVDGKKETTPYLFQIHAPGGLKIIIPSEPKQNLSVSHVKPIFDKMFFFEPIRQFTINDQGGHYHLNEDGRNLTATIRRILSRNREEREQLDKYVRNLVGARISVVGSPETVHLTYPSFETPLLESGTGIMQQIMLATKLIEFEENKHEIIFIDDVQAYLHPTAQRSLFELIKRQAKKSHRQIIYTSHSSVFVDLNDYMNYKVVSKTGSFSKIKNPRVGSKLKNSMDYFDSKKTFLFSPAAENAEMLFSNLVIIVEGASEKHSLPLIFK